MDLVDEEDVALVEVREQCCKVSLLLDGGAGRDTDDVTRMSTPISAAMMPASVVLPSPGGP